MKGQSEGGEFDPYLRSRKKHKKCYGIHDGRGRIPNRVSIDQRPAVVGKRSRTGDWEIDTSIGNNHCGALVSLAKRKSRLSLIARLASKSAGGVKPAVIDWLSPLKAKVCTLTSNQGKEFTEHKSKVKNLEAKFFFAYPYA